MQRVNDLLVREHTRVRLLRGLDLPHQKLTQPSLADIAPDRRSRERPVERDVVIIRLRVVRRVRHGRGFSRALDRSRDKEIKQKENNGETRSARARSRLPRGYVQR